MHWFNKQFIFWIPTVVFIASSLASHYVHQLYKWHRLVSGAVLQMKFIQPLNVSCKSHF